MARRASEFGVTIGGAVSVDWASVRARKDAVLEASRNGVESWLRGMPGCTVIKGDAQFVGPLRLRVNDEALTAEQIFINVGGRPFIPPMPGADQVPLLTNETLLDLDRLPERLVIVGGGYVGLEFAQIFRRFGSDVVLIEKGDRLAPREDPDVSAAIQGIVEDDGVEVRPGAECISFERRGDEIAVGVNCTSNAEPSVGTHVLVAVGRKPNTDRLGLEAAGVATDARGFITVDDQLRTSAPGVWALGDCNGRGAFTHTAYNDFEIVADNLLAGASRRVSDRIPCYGLFTDPPLGRVGMTETEARARGHSVRIGARPMTRVARAREKGETKGFMKVVVDAKTDLILGAALLGVGGDEAVHGVIMAMAAGLTASAYTKVVAIHPTVAELLPTTLGELQPTRDQRRLGPDQQPGPE